MSDELRPSPQPGMTPGHPMPQSGALPLAIGLGDVERERILLPALEQDGSFVIMHRSLAADELLAYLREHHVAAVLVAFDLHRLNSTILRDLVQSGVPLVLLVPDPSDARWAGVPVVLPLALDAVAIRLALEDTVRGERPRLAPTPNEPPAGQPTVPPEQASAPPPAEFQVLACISGRGSPGRTTVALNLATALGAVAPTVLVDVDVCGPSVAAYIDADPTRNLSMLAHADPHTPQEWDLAIESEVQPIAARSPHGYVICGIPKLEMRGGVAPAFFERLIAKLKTRYRYIILDTGADLLGPDVALHRTATGLADLVVLVADSSIVGLWHARTALRLLHEQLAVCPERTRLLINRHDRRYHHRRTEIEWNLGASIGVVPFDYRAASRALMAQQPLVMNGRSRAAQALRDLAQRIHGGTITLPPEQEGNRVTRWWQAFSGRFSLREQQSGSATPMPPIPLAPHIAQPQVDRIAEATVLSTNTPPAGPRGQEKGRQDGEYESAHGA